MSHLSFETIARLVDDAPTALEAAHLAACEHCRDELQEMHGQVAQLRELPALEPPADDWERLERRLAAEGLIRRHAPRRIWLHYGLRAAAALALFTLGTLSGQFLLATSPAGSALAAGDTPRQTTPARSVAVTPGERAAPVAALPPATRLASDETADPADPAQALQQLRAAESSYLDALTRFAELSGNTTAGNPAARLAALEGIVLTTRAALGKAPTDPVINGYHLTAMAQRDATIRQIAATNSETWF